ncbi:MAG: DUF1549 domain-containing protein, partial [Verrucomicrobiae bacterium]|nr:DUF1549 domain-containing protein [Verrucomicrobiae bacterium]
TVVDRLLDSSAYAERMAAEWLDVARYADTYGRHEDFDCVTWPWRDWVIKSFEENLPYDRFVLLQTAGDLLPGARQAQIIPTTFNRLNMEMNEAGSNPEEYRCESVADRVITNGHAFLGLTMECTRCHDHKYDPMTMRDFYSMGALLGNIDELGLYCRFTNAVPTPTVFVQSETVEREHEELLARIDAKVAARESLRNEAKTRFYQWLKSNHPPGPDHPPGLMDKLGGWLGGPPRQAHHLPDPVDAFDFEELIDRREFLNLRDRERHGKSQRILHQCPGPDGLGKGIHFENDVDTSVELTGAGEFSRTDPFSLSAWVKLDGDLDEGAILHRTRSALEAAHRGYELAIENNHVVFKL